MSTGSTAGKTSRLVRTERAPLSLSDFAAEMFDLSEGSEHINGLVYGDSNSGKTVLAGTLPGRTFWLVGEPGYKSAARQPNPVRGKGRRISDSATAWAAVEFLEHRNRFEQLDWLVIDGGTTMQDRFRLAYAAEAFDINPAKRQHRNLPDQPDYFNTQNFLKAWVPRIIDMRVNTLWTFHAYRTDKTENGELLVFPGIQGKVTETANAVSGLMDFTAYLEARHLRVRNSNETRLVRRLWFESPPARKGRGEQEIRYIAGDKFNCLGPYMDNPTMPKILAKIEGTDE